MVGLVSGLILLYFFKIKTVRTPLFTGFNHEGKAIDFLNHENLALLVVWCFISGFSKTFVTDSIFKTVSKEINERLNSKGKEDVDAMS